MNDITFKKNNCVPYLVNEQNVVYNFTHDIIIAVN